ncbi:MAG TPA: tetratricopeptide repeat protein [Anaerolineae bacterium]|nr:tetratricopeptide repeat protein [Anaerolineae bacterium]
MIPNISRPKITIPRRRNNILSRKRLLDAFEDILDYKLILVSAPAGYGKTSLLIDLADKSELPVCWYSLDPLDKELQRFLGYFIASISQCFPEFGERSSLLIQDDAHLLNNLDQVVTMIVNDAYEHINEHFIMVLDDYHAVEESDAVNTFINRFVQDVDENFHLIISSRTLVSLPDLPLLVGRSQVWGLSYEELAFRPDEIRTLVYQNYHRTLSQSEVNELEQETEGWITGLLLSAQTEWQGEMNRARLGNITAVGLYDYMAQQILDQQPPNLQKILLHTSLLGEFNAQLCGQVLGEAPGESDWKDALNLLLSKNLFVQQVGERSTWIRYHHLFRDFLRSKMLESHPKEREEILRRLAKTYIRRKEWERAYEVYTQLEDFEAAACMVEDAGRAMLRGGRLSALAGWIDNLPKHIRNAHPILLSLRGYVFAVLGEGAKGLDLLNQSAKLFELKGNKERVVGVMTWRSAVYRMLGNYRASIIDSEETLEMAKELDEARIYIAEALRNKGLSQYRIGKVREGAECLEQALRIYDEMGERDFAALTGADLGIVYRNMREYTRAEEKYHVALDYWRDKKNVVRQVSVLNNLGILAQMQGDYEQALNYLEEALTHAHSIGYGRVESFALTSIGDLYLELEAHQAALNAYQQAEAIANDVKDRFLLFYIYAKRAHLANSDLEPEGALRFIEVMETMMDKNSSGYECGIYSLAAGNFALSQNDTVRARAMFLKAIECLHRGGSPLEIARAHLSLANSEYLSANQDQAYENISVALSFLANQENDHDSTLLVKDYKELFGFFQEDHQIGESIRRLLMKVEKFEKRIPNIRRVLRRKNPSLPFAPPKLEIQAFGYGNVKIDGEPIIASEWVQQRTVRSMFFYLLSHPFGVSKEVIGIVFWPESSNSQLKRQFKNTIYRLRRALGKDVILFDGELYRFNKDIDYEYDVEIFQEKLEFANKENNVDYRLEAYQEAINLYRGDFLQDVGEGWAILDRELLRRSYQNTLISAAEIYFERKAYELVLDFCERAINEDPCVEAAYRLEMKAHDAMGNRIGVVNTYERCKAALEKDLDILPSPKTEELYLYLTH